MRLLFCFSVFDFFLRYFAAMYLVLFRLNVNYLWLFGSKIKLLNQFYNMFYNMFFVNLGQE